MHSKQIAGSRSSTLKSNQSTVSASQGVPLAASIKKKRGNPNWGKFVEHSVEDIQPSSFEQIVRELRLSPDQYLGSVQLKEWVRKNKDQKYVPSDLLKAWDFEG